MGEQVDPYALGAYAMKRVSATLTRRTYFLNYS